MAMTMAAIDRTKFQSVSLTPPDDCSNCGYKGELLPPGCVCKCCAYYKPEGEVSDAINPSPLSTRLAKLLEPLLKDRQQSLLGQASIVTPATYGMASLTAQPIRRHAE